MMTSGAGLPLIFALVREREVPHRLWSWIHSAFRLVLLPSHTAVHLGVKGEKR